MSTARRISPGVALAALAVLTRAHAVECPATVPVEESLAAAAVAPWTPFDTLQGAYYFYGVTFSDGPPQNRVFLTPVKTVRLKSKHEDVYDFKAAGITEVWLLCQYRDTSIGVARRLEPGIGRCRVIYDATTDFRSVKSIDCG